MLQSAGVRGAWTLKTPNHAMAHDALTAEYPDARMVLLHRNPTVLCDADHTAYIAEHWTQMLAESVDRTETVRLAHPEHEIIDVHYFAGYVERHGIPA